MTNFFIVIIISIGALRELGLQMNEGLANQVEEFARTLHNSSTISELIDDGDDDNDDNDDDSEHESNGLKSTGNHFDV